MKKIIASAAAALLVAGGIVAAIAAPASAHTGGVTGVASCEADGTYTVTWTYAATNVPDGKEAETKAMTTSAGTLAPVDGVEKGGQVFLSVWSEHQVNVPGAPVKTGNWSAQFKSVGIPGDSTQVTTMVQTDWKNGPSEDPVGKVILDGECGAVTPPEKPEPKTEHDETVVYGEWSAPEIDCDSEVGDEATITREVTTTPRTRTTGEPTYDASTNTWTQGAFGEWVDGESATSTEEDIYVVTAEDIAGLECATPTPTPTPSETSAPTPTATETPAPVGNKLAATGGETVAALTAGALGIALLGLGTVLALKRRRG